VPVSLLRISQNEAVISPASQEDSRRIAELMVAAFQADRTSDISKLLYPPLPPAEREKRDSGNAKAFSQIIALDKQKIIKAVIGDVVVGFAMWTPSEEDWLPAPKGDGFAARYIRQLIKTRRENVGGTRYWYLAILAVDPKYWGHGVGSKLVQWGLNRADDDKVDCCYLESSMMAQPLYASMGFKTIAWDCIEEKEAKDGVCKWPVMIRRRLIS
jgi:GNAT superfamily N-acetyltransferase